MIYMMKVCISLIVFVFLNVSLTQGTKLYPRETDIREIIPLDGLWNFYLNKDGKSTDTLSGNSNDKDIFLMPVPSSYNDIVTTIAGRDYSGQVTYERTFFLPSDWFESDTIIWLRFGSVTHSASVYINDKLVTQHTLGHLPFVIDITSHAHVNENTIKVIVDNTLKSTSIPQGHVSKDGDGVLRNRYTFAFFNYAGIDRSVVLYKTAKSYVDDITLVTKIDDTTGIIEYNIVIGGTNADISIIVLDQSGEQVFIQTNAQNQGIINIPQAQLWWPYLMSDTPGYLYTFRVELSSQGVLVDSYEQPFGIRELQWDATRFLINSKSVYFRGFSRHEDSDFRGKGTDISVILRDHNLLRWVGANSFRTSNYPYSEEVMDLADQMGFMVIDESPAVLLTGLDASELLDNHKQAIRELYARDKNRPSVVMWSVAADPVHNDSHASSYFKAVTDLTRSLDVTRPITIPTTNNYHETDTQQYADIMSFNKYEGWQSNAGDLDTIAGTIEYYGRKWHEVFRKPVLCTEYGANTQEGFHALPQFVWSEEYQQQLLGKHFEAFDQLRQNGYFIGEMLFNFADFKSPQTIFSVGGNKDGVFTRNRQPKSGAFTIRKRYWTLAQEIDKAAIPSDLDIYTGQPNVQYKDEL